MTHISPLESRTLLASDLALAFVSTNLPLNVVAGVPAKYTATLAVTLTGDALPKTNKGTVAVSVNALVFTLESGADRVPVSLGTAIVKASVLKPGKPVKAVVKLAVPSTLTGQGLPLSASLDPGTTLTDANPDNNTLSIPGFVSANAPSADVAIVASINTSDNVASGTPAKVFIELSNPGNIPAKGTGKVEIFSTVAGTPTLLATLPKVSINLAPLTTKPFRTNVPITLTSGSTENITATISARFTPTTAFTGDQTFNNDYQISPITITPSTAPTADKPFPGSNLGNTLNFRNDTVLPFIEGGFYTSNNGLQGIWANSPGRKDTFTLSVTAEPQTSIIGTIKTTGNAIGTRTLIFGVPKAGSNGSLTLKDSKVVIYFKFA